MVSMCLAHLPFFLDDFFSAKRVYGVVALAFFFDAVASSLFLFFFAVKGTGLNLSGAMPLFGLGGRQRHAVHCCGSGEEAMEEELTTAE